MEHARHTGKAQIERRSGLKRNTETGWQLINYKQAVLLIFTAILFIGSFILPEHKADVSAANPGAGNSCAWHKVVAGDSLSRIAYYNGTTIAAMAKANAIRNIHLIYIGQSLCIPRGSSLQRTHESGLQANGQVRWYAHRALEVSNRNTVNTIIRSAAARYNLPPNLLLAIGWQESGWTQHVIARDGGIGAMQIMPYTANGLNQQVSRSYDPYKLYDNVELSAILLRSLWRIFHGDLTKIISAYNQGAWNVQHKGIFNWPYVNNVKALMGRY